MYSHGTQKLQLFDFNEFFFWDERIFSSHFVVFSATIQILTYANWKV